jgi:hypothetical protein
MSFLPENYQEPSSVSNFMKFKQGDNLFRVVSNAITGWEYWMEEGGKKKVIRVKTREEVPAQYLNATGREKARHFWAFVVYNFKDKEIQMLEATQKSIQSALYTLAKDEDWGDPKEYNILVNRKGEELETEYHVAPKPKSILTEDILEAIENKKYNLENLFIGASIFENGLSPEDNVSSDIDLDSIPF